jgi:SAM-dependent methyltransferase
MITLRSRRTIELGQEVASGHAQREAMIGPRAAARRLPTPRRRQLRRLLRRPLWGNLRRSEPISPTFGFDRGTPVDRYYMLRFLAEHAAAVRGVVGEIAEARYVRQFGDDRLTRVEIIDIDPGNPHATLVADLAESSSLPAATFDTLVVLQTLQYTTSVTAALGNCIQALRPGGSLLLAMPGLTAHDDRIPLEEDRWRFLPAGVDELLRAAAPEARRRVVGYGNLVAALAFLHGISAEELRPRELDRYDARYPVVTCARLDLPGPVA